MKKYISFTALLAGLLLLTSACEQFADINGQLRPAGTPIVFAASTGYQNAPETRTVYSGDHDNTVSGIVNPFERIDWVNGDPITVEYIRGNGTPDTGTYTVGTPTTTGNEISEASLSGTELYWAEGSGDHVFYSMYPSNGFGGNNTANISGNQVSGRILKTQPITRVSNTKTFKPAMNYAYMVAREVIGENSSDREVVLHFVPAMTAFEFKFKLVSGYAARDVIGFTMTSTDYIAGDFSFNISGGTGSDRSLTWNSYQVTNNTNRSNSISVSFGTPITLSTSEFIDFTILALPVDIHNVTITFEFSDHTTKSLDLKHEGSFVTFLKCKKYIITNDVPGSDVWHYRVDEIDDITTYGHDTVTGLPYTVKSYRWNDREGINVKYPVKWKTQYTTDGGTTWTDLTASGYVKDASTTFKVSRLNGDGVGTASYSTGEGSNASIHGTSNATISGDPSAGAAIRALLATRPERGSAVGVNPGPFDLSTHPTYGTIDTQGQQNTANSYVVSAPGVYMFPCVYGNAIKNGRNNKSAYWPSAADDTNYDLVTGSPTTLSDINTTYNTDNYVQHYYTPRFYNALNRPITTPYIKNDLNASGLNAIVLWQDTYVGDEIIPYTTGYVGMTTVNGVDYIWFKVDKEHIQPGNVVIALKGSAGTLSDEILWSWHIWVTEKDLTPTDEVVNNAGTYYLMPYNLGWVDTVDGSVEKYDNRTVEYRIVQTDSNGNELPIADPTGDDELFTVTQIGDAITVQASIGANPYYQWGRKDPQIPAIPVNYNATQYDCTSRQVSPNPNYNIPTNGALVPAQAVSTRVMDYASGIKLPYVPLSNIEANNGRTATGWVGGPVYPYQIASGAYLLTKEDRGPFLYGQALQCNNAGLTTSSDWRTEEGTGALAGVTLFYIKDNVPYNFGPYTQAQKDILVSIDSNAHFSNSDFLAGPTPYPASWRSKSGTPYNLWNSYIYAERSHENDVNKFKTIYDPCPPGFTVPSRQVFIGNNTASVNSDNRTKSAPPTWIPTSRETASVMLNGNPTTKTIGVNFNAGGTNPIFLPFTGSRVFYHNNGNPNLQAEWAGGMGFYWTDNPYGIDFLPGESNQYTIASFWWFHSSYSFSFAYPSYTSQTYTKGSAFSIRPMVDPKY